MRSVGSILGRVLAKQPRGQELLGSQAAAAMARLLGSDLASQCTLEMRGSVLHLTTPNPALAHQLRLDSPKLIERLNGLGMLRKVSSLRVRTGSIEPPRKR